MRQTRTISRVLWTTLLVLAASLLGGCTYLRETVGLGPQRPKVHLADVAVTRVRLTNVDLLVTVRVDNPNGFALKFSRLRYQLTAAEADLARGVYDEPLSIPAEGQSLIKLPLTVDAKAALKLAQDLLTSSGEVFAVMKATADFGTPFGDMEVNFEDKHPLRKLTGF